MRYFELTARDFRTTLELHDGREVGVNFELGQGNIVEVPPITYLEVVDLNTKKNITNELTPEQREQVEDRIYAVVDRHHGP